MKISVIGCGFVGLPLVAFFASKGIKTFAVDSNTDILNGIQKIKPHFYEKDLKNLLKKGSKNIICTTSIAEAIKNSDLSFITVGTPPNKDGSSNLKFIKQVACEIGNALKDKNTNHLVIVKSTVPPFTTNNIVGTKIKRIIGAKLFIKIGLIMNPEFLKEGSIVDDTLNPYLIVIGCNKKSDGKILEKLYKDVYKTNTPEILLTTIETSEMIKYSNNAFLATKISFINTIANICQKIKGTDVGIISYAIGKDPRIGSEFLKAGPGYGGSCFPKDLDALIAFCKKNKFNPELITATQKVNNTQYLKIVKLMKVEIGNLKGKRISVLGLSFKKDTDDIRESVSIKLIKYLLKKGAQISSHDPMAINNAKKIFSDKINFETNIKNCIAHSDCCVIMTDWDEYKKLKPNIFEKMNTIHIIDARRILNDKTKSKIKVSTLGTN